MPDCHAMLFGPPDAQPPRMPPPPWLADLRERDGLMVLRDAAIPAPWGMERLPVLVLHRRGGVIVEGRRASAIACLADREDAESPCMPVLDSHRRVALLRRYVMGRARRLFPRRLFPARFAAGLSFEALVVVEGASASPGHRAACAALVPSAAHLAWRIDALAHPSAASSAQVLRREDMALLAADLTAEACPDGMEARHRPGMAPLRALGAEA